MEQFSLFQKEVPQPLAARLRPQTLDEFVGQTQLLGPGKVLRRLIDGQHPGYTDPREACKCRRG